MKKVCIYTMYCFFFSSRRRHTRCSRDWSSDVCSSDLVTEKLVHVDIQEVRADRAITVRVAVHPVGEAVGVRDTKGILNLVMHEVEVSTLPTNIPERIDADVSNLAIGDVLTVRDLRPPDGVRIVNDPGQAVATVSPPMAEEVAPTPEVAAAVTPAEPEGLTERKPQDEAAPAEAEGKKAPVAAAAKKPEAPKKAEKEK